jgi:predicted GH43/DUF377 family glycosyl hydrolase
MSGTGQPQGLARKVLNPARWGVARGEIRRDKHAGMISTASPEQTKVFQLQRASCEPLVVPRAEVRWERGACLNSAVIFEGGVWHLLYRAIDHEPGWKQGRPGPYLTSVGLATSTDGLHFTRREEPVIPYGFYGPNTEAQDCRLVKIDGLYHLTYCLYDKSRGIPTTGCSVSSDLVHWEHRGELTPFDEFGFNKNAALFPEKIGGRFCLMHRPEAAAFRHLPAKDFNWRTWSRGPSDEGDPQTGITLSYSDDLRHWTDSDVVLAPRPGLWDNIKVGAGAPPIRTPQGWLNVYHGVDERHVYRLGIALHDADDPTVVLKRQEEPILQPELEWECRGDVDGAIFTCGAVLHGTRLQVYYAGADTVIGLAEGDVHTFLTT